MAFIDRKSALSGQTVRGAMRRLICYLERHASIQQAIRHSIKYKINAVLIVERNHEAIGVVSKTDILGAYYAGLPVTTPVEAIMATPPIVCHQEDFLDAALDAMRNAQVHRLYVVGEEPGRVVGVLAYPDILGMLYRYCHRCERSTLRGLAAGATGKLADYFRVCELMNPAFEVHGEDDSLMQVMESISAHHSRTVLIKGRNDLPLGVVSTTDLILAFMHGIPASASAKTVMNVPVLSSDYEEPLLLAVKKMIFYDLDALYVYKDKPVNIVGIVTLADVARVRSGSCRACIVSRIDMDE